MNTRPISRKRITREQNHLWQQLQKNSSEMLKNPWVKVALGIGVVYGALFVSKYFIREYASLVEAIKRLQRARKL